MTRPPALAIAEHVPVIDIQDMPQSGPLLGLDPGTKTIGVAACDRDRMLASAVETIRRQKFAVDAARLFELFDERGCVGMVIGLPLNMDGSEGPRAQSARAFAANIDKARAIPITLWDERLSTAAVERSLIATDTSRARRAEIVDAMAAAYILQGAIDRMRSATS